MNGSRIELSADNNGVAAGVSSAMGALKVLVNLSGADVIAPGAPRGMMVK